MLITNFIHNRKYVSSPILCCKNVSSLIYKENTALSITRVFSLFLNAANVGEFLFFYCYLLKY